MEAESVDEIPLGPEWQYEPKWDGLPSGATCLMPAAPAMACKWSTKRSSEWQPLKNKLVVEVQYDHFTGDRFRHGTRLLRWRGDKLPAACTFDQVRKKGAPR